ncbi:MAG: hypothetical protein LAN83_17435 [Acidobacteriia bacterium]|nr:hypothetical protein [Terriglobia bacterium]
MITAQLGGVYVLRSYSLLVFMLLLLLTGVSLAAPISPVFHAFVWTSQGGMQDLGTLGALESGAAAINASGQVVGTLIQLPDGAQDRAYFWSSSTGMQDLGTLPGHDISFAYSINRSGVVVGMSGKSTDSSTFRGFTWTATSGMRSLGKPPGTVNSSAIGINDSGVVLMSACVALCSSSTLTQHGFVSTPSGGWHDIGTLGGQSTFVSAIANDGTVVGCSNPPGYTDCHAFIWTRLGGMRDLGTLNGHYGSVAYAINSLGNVVGESHKKGAAGQDVLWPSGQAARALKSLGGGVSYALGINDHNQIVGYSWVNGGGAHAFLLDKNGIRDLGTLGGVADTSSASAINSSGVVVGSSDVSTGPSHSSNCGSAR